MKDSVQTYISTQDGLEQLTYHGNQKFIKTEDAIDDNTIIIDPKVEHQSILGFGGTMLDSDLYNLMRMSTYKCDEVLQSLFHKSKGAGWNFVRVPFGSTDWERNTKFYSYDDMPLGSKDFKIQNFSIQRDIERGLPELLHKIKEINPEVIFLASVWAIPGWMKDNDSIIFGLFNPECTKIYAKYLRMAVEAWKEQGIEFYALTVQNEPLTSEDRATPACRMTGRMQSLIIKALKDEFNKFEIKVEIWCYDHNFDMCTAFIDPMLSDPELYKIIDGVAMHDYGGSPEVMGKLQAKYPDMPFYMTERYSGDVESLGNLIQQFHNGSRSYIQWTTMTDEFGGPHQFLGRPFIYDKPVQADRRNFVYNYLNDADNWKKGSSWGLYAQFTKFIRRGMVRVDCSYGDRKWITCTAFKGIDDNMAVIVVNQTNINQEFKLLIGEGQFKTEVPSKSIATYLISLGELCGKTVVPVSSEIKKNFIEEESFDIELIDIKLESYIKAGEEAVFQAIIKNVGNCPTKEGSILYVSFFLDGDLLIGKSVTVPPIINPSCEIVVTVNISMGFKCTWTAEPGYHLINAYAELGNTSREMKTDNNRLIKEFLFN